AVSTPGAAGPSATTSPSSLAGNGIRQPRRRALLAWSAAIASSQVAGVPRRPSYWWRLAHARASASCTTSSRSAPGASRATRCASLDRCGRTHSVNSTGSSGAACGSWMLGLPALPALGPSTRGSLTLGSLTLGSLTLGSLTLGSSTLGSSAATVTPFLPLQRASGWVLSVG